MGIALLLGLLGGIVLAVISAVLKSKIGERRKREYIYALTLLRQDPSNSGLRMQTLKAGREYLAAYRPKGRLTAQDEIAIGNDISAASGGRW